MKVKVLITQSCLFVIARLLPLSIEFSRQEYWSCCHTILQGNLPNPVIESRSPALQADYLPSEPPCNKPIKENNILKRNSLFINYLYHKYTSLDIRKSGKREYIFHREIVKYLNLDFFENKIFVKTWTSDSMQYLEPNY